MCPRRLGSRPVVRLIASPGRSSSFVIWNETCQIESVEYRSTPQIRLSHAEQSMPFFIELPPHTYGMLSIVEARASIALRISNDGSTAFSTAVGTGGGGGGATATGPFGFAGSARSEESDVKSGAAVAGHSSSSATRRTITTRSVARAKK